PFPKIAAGAFRRALRRPVGNSPRGDVVFTPYHLSPVSWAISATLKLKSVRRWRPRQAQFHADKSKHDPQANLEVVEPFHDTREQKIKSSQPQNRKNVRSVNDESIRGDAEN